MREWVLAKKSILFLLILALAVLAVIVPYRGVFRIHSAFAPSFYSMDMFVSSEKTMTKDGNGISVNGIIGYFLDIPVVLSDRLYDTTSQEGFILMMKKNALSLLPKESPFTEVARDAAKRLSTIYTSDFYALALVDDTAVVYAKNVIG